jgi:hypothetical protein
MSDIDSTLNLSHFARWVLASFNGLINISRFHHAPVKSPDFGGNSGGGGKNLEEWRCSAV